MFSTFNMTILSRRGRVIAKSHISILFVVKFLLNLLLGANDRWQWAER